MKHSLRILLFLVGSTCLSAGIGLAFLSAQPLKLLPDNVYLGTAALSGLQQTNLSQEVVRIADADAHRQLDLTIGGERFLFPGKEIGLEMDAELTAERIRMLLPKSKAEELWNLWIQLMPVSAQPVLLADVVRLEQSLTNLAEVLNRSPVDATIAVVDGEVVVTPDEKGRTLDTKSISNWVIDQIRKTDQLQLEVGNGIAFQDIYANISAADLLQYRFVLTQAEIQLSDLSEDVCQQFVKNLHGITLKQDVVFDFASIFLDTSDPEVIDSLSSLLFQAVLPVSGIEITERHAAEQMPEFTQPGFEAVVSTGGKLRFVNRTDVAMLIAASLSGDTLTVYLVASDAVALLQPESVLLEILVPEEVESKTHELAPGEVRVLSEGKHGAVVSVRSADGTELYQDIYPAENRVIETGIKRAAVPK